MSRPIALSCLLAVVACHHSAVPPRIVRDADPAEREAVFTANRLTFEGGFWTRVWRRADGAYAYPQIITAVDVYPSSKAARKTAQRRSVVTCVLAAVGGTIVGTTLGNQLFAPPEDRYDDRTRNMLYVVGGGTMLLGIVLDQTWAKAAYRDIATRYNEELRRDLALPPTTY